MGRLCFCCKLEFANTWKGIVAEKIADLAQVEQVTQSISCARYGSISFETGDLADYLVHGGDMICITYDSGYIILLGWLSPLSEGSEDVLMIRMDYYKTFDRKKHGIILEKITEIFDEMAYRKRFHSNH